MLSRVSSYGALGSFVAIPIGLSIAGPVADGIGVAETLWIAVAVGFVESGLTKAAAIDNLLAKSGSHYDPESVRLFLKVSNLVQLPKQVREIMLHEL